MRGLPLLALLVLGLTAFAGCSDPGPAEPTADVDDGQRTARPGSAQVDDEELEPVELLNVPLQMAAGQGPASFDVEVPADVASVAFGFSGGPTFQAVELRVELSGCGAYGHGGVQGSTPANFDQELCGPAAAGPQTVTVSGALVVFDGTFSLTGFVPLAGNATAAA